MVEHLVANENVESSNLFARSNRLRRDAQISLNIQPFRSVNFWWVDKMVDKLRGKYLFQKRGVYYFSKQIPKDVRQHYSQNRIVQSLKTKSVKAAFYQSQNLLHKLNQHWFYLRVKDEIHSYFIINLLSKYLKKVHKTQSSQIPFKLISN